MSKRRPRRLRLLFAFVVVVVFVIVLHFVFVFVVVFVLLFVFVVAFVFVFLLVFVFAFVFAFSGLAGRKNVDDWLHFAFLGSLWGLLGVPRGSWRGSGWRGGTFGGVGGVL